MKSGAEPWAEPPLPYLRMWQPLHDRISAESRFRTMRHSQVRKRGSAPALIYPNKPSRSFIHTKAHSNRLHLCVSALNLFQPLIPIR